MPKTTIVIFNLGSKWPHNDQKNQKLQKVDFFWPPNPLTWFFVMLGEGRGGGRPSKKSIWTDLEIFANKIPKFVNYIT